MLVKKSDKSLEPFMVEKVLKGVEKAYASVNENMKPGVLDCIIGKYKDEDDEKIVDADEIQDEVEKCLMEDNKVAAKSYILYRYTNKIRKDKFNTNVKSILKKLMAEDVQNQNANVDEHSFDGRMGEASSFVNKKIALDGYMSRKSRKNHLNNEVYIHDLDAYVSGKHNCLTEPIDLLFAKGFVTRQADVRSPGSVATALQLLAVVFQLQSQDQFGGVAAGHLDWSLVPYVRLSFYKHFMVGLKFVENVGNDAIAKFKKEFFSLPNDDDFKFLEEDTIDKRKHISIDNKIYKSYEKAYDYALSMLKDEVFQSVEAMYSNLNTLQSRSGCQLPFTSLNYGTCTKTEGRLVIKALLEGSLDGTGKFHKTPIFPCGIFQLMKGVNRYPGEPNYDLYKLALKSTSQRLYPNYANCDWTTNAGYDKEDPRTYFATMGCHAINTPIIMADGTRKMVQDIKVGDKIMGVNNTVRTVESLIRGNDKLFKISQSRGEDYIVNEGHVLALEYSVKRKYMGYSKGDKLTMTVHDFMQIPASQRRHFKGYKDSYELEEKEYAIPPYILGLWLGDGWKGGATFSVNINETKIVEDISKYAESIGRKVVIKEEEDEKCLVVTISDKDKQHENNLFRQGLKKYNLFDNKHIPEEYFYGSKAQRSALLAGLVNTDGWARIGRGRQTVCFGNTNIDLINGAKRLADSLGYATNIIKARGEAIGVGLCEGSKLKPYYHLSIHAFDDENLMESKRTNINKNSIRNFNTSVLTVEEVGNGDFYGFELDGDRLYLFNDCTVTHNCRTYNGRDINAEEGHNPQTKDGRGNLAPVTIILPTIAMEAKTSVKDGENVVDKFMKLLDKKIHEAKDMLRERYDWLCKQSPLSAKFMWKNNTMLGYIPEQGIESALRHGTLAIGQLGLAECLQALIGTDHTTEEGMQLAKRIEGLYKKRCQEFKESERLNYGVYYTPAENLCYTAMKKFREKYGVIPNVSDRDYFTNSMHVPVWKNMTPFEKIDIESQLTGYSNAGCITYVELPSTTKNNLEALETIVNYAMDRDIPYFAINVPNDTCNECGYTDEINDKCPMCGSTNISRLRRVTGYLTGDYKTAFNWGKQKETQDRVKHIKEF